MDEKKPIRTFQDLEVYQAAYRAMLDGFKYVLPALPPEEKFDLADQLRRSTKAIPRLIAEGHSKRHQRKDLYPSLVDAAVCEKLMDIYDKTSRQCYNLAVAWDKFAERKPTREQ